MSTKIPPLPSLRDILRMYNLTALKSLSQNFLLDMNLCNKIVKQLGPLDGRTVIEVGSGPGGLTRAILGRNPGKVILVEKDRRFLPALDHLREIYTQGALDIVHGDILTTEFGHRLSGEVRTLWSDNQDGLKLVGNLPFSISNPLLVRFLQQMSEKSELFSFGRTPLVLTFQYEVAERIVAPPCSPMRCRLSAICQTYAESTLCFTIPGRCFLPPPDVNVGVVKIVPRVTPLIVGVDFKFLERFFRLFWNQRQKYCSNSLGSLFPKEYRREMTDQLILAAGVHPKLACFEFSNEQLRDTVYAYKEMCDAEPDLVNYNPMGPRSARLRL